MQKALNFVLAALAVSVWGGMAAAEAQKHDHAHDHGHAGQDHAGHDHGGDAKAAAFAKGYFEDSDVSPRALSDWEGLWQSVYPLLQSGRLEPVMAAKAASGEKSAAAYHDYYEKGYATDVHRIEITGDLVTFVEGTQMVSAHYASDGYEILTYEKGNRGVRYVFKKASGAAEAPDYIQFSDHIIQAQPSGHYHLYFGNDRAALLAEVSHWPTYYPASLRAEEVVAEMLAH